MTSHFQRVLRQHGFRVVENMVQEHISQLLRFSKDDPIVRRFTSDPVRFADLNAFSEWRTKGKNIYVLENDLHELCGIVWFGKKPFPLKVKKVNMSLYSTTLAIRLYGAARGKHLAWVFLAEAFRRYIKHRKFPFHIWVQTSFDNLPVLALLRHMNGKQVTSPDGRGKILLVCDIMPEMYEKAV